MKLLLKSSHNEHASPLHSKLGGSPTFPHNFLEDYKLNDDLFVAQLNLEDLQIPFLPNNGMLYFFIDVTTYPCKAKVIYTNDDIVEMYDNINEGFEEFNNNQEYLLIPTTDHSAISLLDELEDDNQKIILFSFDSLEVDNKILSLGNPDSIYRFIIDKQDLTKLNFQNVDFEIYGS